VTILVTGGTGLVGYALQKVLPNTVYLSSKDCDLRNHDECLSMIKKYMPEYIFHLAAKVGGVKANSDFAAEFYYDNILINTNVLNASYNNNVKKVVSLLSTCVYPDKVNYPLTEEQIHNGEPHKSNFAYAYAKRMLDVQSRSYRKQYGCNFITAVPNNLFGENDNFDLENSHVIPAIIRKIHEASLNNENVILWGDGSPIREFTYSLDLANILLFILEKYDGKHPINVGNTKQYSIKEVANMIAEIMEFKNEIIWDSSYPSGQYKKPSDNSNLLSLGWREENYTNFYDALKNTCKWFIISYPNLRGIS
jgi:GDP-L-fucose synthase